MRSSGNEYSVGFLPVYRSLVPSEDHFTAAKQLGSQVLKMPADGKAIVDCVSERACSPALPLSRTSNCHHRTSTATAANGVREDWRMRSGVQKERPSESTSSSADAVFTKAPRRQVTPDGPAFMPTSTLVIEVLEQGASGRTATAGDSVTLHYATLLQTSGCCVDASRSKAFQGVREPSTWVVGQGQVVVGMDVALQCLTLGTIARVHVPHRYAYGGHAAGPIQPYADLVFEIEILAINDEQAAARDSWLVRQLFTLSPPRDLPEDETDEDLSVEAFLLRTGSKMDGSRWRSSAQPKLPDGHRILVCCQPHARARAAHAEAAEARRRFDLSDSEAIGAQAAEAERGAAVATAPGPWWTVGSASNSSSDGEDCGSEAMQSAGLLPSWITRLRSTLPQPCPELRSYLSFCKPLLERLEQRAQAAAPPPAAEKATCEDLGPQLVPGAAAIHHMPYGTRWDSKQPAVLTGERNGWPAKDWGWEFWERDHGAHYVTCKQRAPLFDEDHTAGVLMAECTLRECMAYCKTAHLDSRCEAGAAPVLYMNGWDVFEAIPELWQPGMDRIPGTIDNLTADGYHAMHRSLGVVGEGTDESIDERIRRLCKLFVGPVGAITRIHQDNHQAHAWLCNLRGRKLYVLCSPDDSPKVAPVRSRSKAYGTRYEGRLDPLDPQHLHRAQRDGLQLYATVLEPGQTILAPSGWWHYAVSLTPTITLMCNFWDLANMRGLEDCFLSEISKVIDVSRREQKGGKHVKADQAVEQRALDPPVAYKVVNKPFVYVRAKPSTLSEPIGILRAGDVLTAGAEHDGWVCTAEPFERGKYGWTLIDGAQLGLGALLQRLADEHKDAGELLAAS